MHMTNTGTVGYLILLHVQLYQISPALVVLTFCIVAILVQSRYTAQTREAMSCRPATVDHRIVWQ